MRIYSLNSDLFVGSVAIKVSVLFEARMGNPTKILSMYVPSAELLHSSTPAYNSRHVC
jgi:hypothetical protein